jgi:hypothetical protein
MKLYLTVKPDAKAEAIILSYNAMEDEDILIDAKAGDNNASPHINALFTFNLQLLI